MSTQPLFRATGELARTTGELPATQLPEALPARTRRILFLLAASIALMMTGYGIVMPVFAKRLGELGSGVAALGLMSMGFAFAQLVLSPFLGSLADRAGRKPLILMALAGEVVANSAFIVAPSTGWYIAIRVFQGAITAGLLPAVLGVVADTVPESQRARWMGIVMGSYGAGFIFGPAVGGFLFDHWGFAAPFTVSATLALIGLLLAFIMVPETRSTMIGVQQRNPSAGQKGLLASLPKPLYLFGTLLALDFISTFGFAFIEPQMMFYMYNQLSLTPTQLGIIVGGYGLAMLLGQAGLGQLSDRYGRKPLIVLGLLLSCALYPGLIFFPQFGLLFLIAVISGIGGALVSPALSAAYLDHTPPEHRSQVMGIRGSSAALGGVAGPLLVAVVSLWVSPQGIFTIAGGVTLAAVLLALLVLKRGITSAVAPVPTARADPS
ncbi:MAG: MFS transporter [Chloroflexi bacterium]|nr:MFS transporter [Chloroflexota bacterium]